MNNPKDIEQGVKQILRRLDKAIQRENQEEAVAANQPDETPTQTVADLLPEALFGVGMGFVTVFTGMLAILVTDATYKVMFGSFATICLLMCAHKLDKVSRQYQKLRKENRAT